VLNDCRDEALKIKNNAKIIAPYVKLIRMKRSCRTLARNFDTLLFLKNNEVIILTDPVTVQRKAFSGLSSSHFRKCDLADQLFLERSDVIDPSKNTNLYE
jgi:hypothetical protein